MSGNRIVPLYKHNLYNEDITSIVRNFKHTLQNMTLTSGPVNKDVAEQFATYLDAKHCLLTSSGSAALTSILIGLNVGPGDEVILPAMTFAATINSVEMLGAKPILVDINPDTKLIDFNSIFNAVTNNTKAVIVVHLYGQMVNVQALRDILPEEIALVEDAAHAIEASFMGAKPGTYSDAAMFSFYQSKTITTGEGGALITNNTAFYEKLKIIYRHGINLSGYHRHVSEAYLEADLTELGLKANMPDLQAILLPQQIEKLDVNLAKRKAIAKVYNDAFKSFDIEIPHVNILANHAYHIYAIGVSPSIRTPLMIYLNDNGIKSAVHYKALHTTEYYLNKYHYEKNTFPNSLNWGMSTLSIPFYSNLENDDMEYVIEKITNYLKK